MDGERAAATAGVVACVLTAVAVVAPYVVLPAGDQELVGSYYASGPISPLAVGLLALIGAVVFASGRESRSNPDLVAGVMLSVGAFSLLVALSWALGLPTPGGDAPRSVRFLGRVRWLVLAGAALELATALWYAAALGLVGLPGGGSPGRGGDAGSDHDE